jgi:hypothetical protein
MKQSDPSAAAAGEVRPALGGSHDGLAFFERGIGRAVQALGFLQVSGNCRRAEKFSRIERASHDGFGCVGLTADDLVGIGRLAEGPLGRDMMPFR